MLKEIVQGEGSNAVKQVEKEDRTVRRLKGVLMSSTTVWYDRPREGRRVAVDC